MYLYVLYIDNKKKKEKKQKGLTIKFTGFNLLHVSTLLNKTYFKSRIIKSLICSRIVIDIQNVLRKKIVPKCRVLRIRIEHF